MAYSSRRRTTHYRNSGPTGFHALVFNTCELILKYPKLTLGGMVIAMGAMIGGGDDNKVEIVKDEPLIKHSVPNPKVGDLTKADGMLLIPYHINLATVPAYLDKGEFASVVAKAGKSWEECGVRFVETEKSGMPISVVDQRTTGGASVAGQLNARYMVGLGHEAPIQPFMYLTDRAWGNGMEARIFRVIVNGMEILKSSPAKSEHDMVTMEKVVSHEFGHALGLDHDKNGIMTASVDPDREKTGPDKDEISVCRVNVKNWGDKQISSRMGGWRQGPKAS